MIDSKNDMCKKILHVLSHKETYRGARMCACVCGCACVCLCVQALEALGGLSMEEGSPVRGEG